MTPDDILEECEDCLNEGYQLIVDAYPVRGGLAPYNALPRTTFMVWEYNCRLLHSHLGKLGENFPILGEHDKKPTSVIGNQMIAALQSIKTAIQKGRFLTIEDQVLSKAFSSLIAQSQYLLARGYYLAAGVIVRAVLEEKLRSMSEELGLTFTKDRPTLSDYNTKLYGNGRYNKTEMKFFNYLIDIGNKAAHNQPFENEEVETLVAEVTKVLDRY